MALHEHTPLPGRILPLGAKRVEQNMQRQQHQAEPNRDAADVLDAPSAPRRFGRRPGTDDKKEPGAIGAAILKDRILKIRSAWVPDIGGRAMMAQPAREPG